MHQIDCFSHDAACIDFLFYFFFFYRFPSCRSIFLLSQTKQHKMTRNIILLLAAREKSALFERKINNEKNSPLKILFQRKSYLNMFLLKRKKMFCYHA